ncbi:MAG: peptide chain release factor 2 [Verrucomicrobia bacterium]|nr:peptide chain release factor 2 [Verrucomicrobiota bacterium]
MSLPVETIDLASVDSRLRELRRFLDPAKLEAQLKDLEGRMSAPDFWNDSTKAQKVAAEANSIRKKLEQMKDLERKISDLPVHQELAEEDGSPAALAEYTKEVAQALEMLDQTEVQFILSQPDDRRNAILSLNAGAGGTEACDWANILMRMYQRWAERRGYKVEVLDILSGEEAGIKNVMLRIIGENAYGYLKADRGVHRLVRISPFNSQGKRQTSFASAEIVPEPDEEQEIEIPEKDIRVDVFRAGGHGGQGVNTTDSAVRITHFPTGLVVTCQNERSQIKNRATAMKVLAARIRQVELDKKRAEQEQNYAAKGQIGWGHQIRSYVLQPYQMVKDLRTGEQTSDTQAVLDGQIDPFLNAFLKGKKRSGPIEEDEE